MTDHFQLMVPCATTKDDVLNVHAPYDGALIATVDTADQQSVELALATADSLYQKRDNWLPVEQRIEILEKTAVIMHERADELAIGAAREGGKPLVDSKVEVARGTMS